MGSALVIREKKTKEEIMKTWLEKGSFRQTGMTNLSKRFCTNTSGFKKR